MLYYSLTHSKALPFLKKIHIFFNLFRNCIPLFQHFRKAAILWAKLLVLLCLLSSCSIGNTGSKKKIKIGFSQCVNSDAWRQNMNEEMRREIGFYPEYEIELILKDANLNVAKQIADINELAEQNIDFLIVSPVDVDSLNEIIGKYYDSGLPIITIDRAITSDKVTAIIGGDNYGIGKEAAVYTAELLQGKGSVFEIKIANTSTPGIERSKGFIDGLEEFPEIKLESQMTFDEFHPKDLILSHEEIKVWKSYDLIYAHNDITAYKAYEVCKTNGIEKPFIIGIDGLHTPNMGIDMVIKGYLDGTFTYPTGGDKAIQLAIDILKGQEFQKVNMLPSIRIDQLNARTVRHQADQIAQQQINVDWQRKELGKMAFLHKRQETIILLGIVISFLLVIIISMAIYSLRRKQKANVLLDKKNRTIHTQNKRIINQRDKLFQALKVVEEATEAKTRFFSNISHEFRQALSLVILPVNEMIAAENPELLEEKLKRVQKNTLLLSKLSDEILNFEKIEKHKYYINYQTSDFSLFLTEITEAFKTRIEQKGLQFSTRIPQTLEAYFDPTVLETILRNLISNAVKYNTEGGSIEIEVKKINDEIFVAVSDTGLGIAPSDLPFVFDRFYRAEHVKAMTDIPSSGIGLAITKELIHLHQGRIKVSSTLGKGTTFIFRIPVNPLASKRNSKWQIADAEKFLALKNPINKSTLLVVEDNSEILAVMARMLGKYYRVEVATDGEEGLKKALEIVPDLVLSDIYMPNMNGIELCQELKYNSTTFHIPVVLLTAMDSKETKIQGYDIGADAYITKPFNESVLVSQVQNLIESRKKLKEAYSSFSTPLGIQFKEQKEEDFVKNCIRVIHEKGSDESFNLDQLAAYMNVSRSSLYRKIKTITGMKAVDFIKKSKLNYAAKLLIATDMTVSEIAYECGYNDTKYFSRCFTKEYGELPSKFRLGQVKA